MVAQTHPFAYRDFRLFWIGRVASMLAQTILVVALSWTVYDVARLSMGVRSASFQLGLIGLIQFLPVLGLTPISGLVVDLVDRRRVVQSAMAVQALGALAPAAIALGASTTLPALFLVALALGAARAFYLPAMNALAPNLVPRDALPRAIAASALAGRVGAILGPVVGGWVYAVSPRYAFVLAAVLMGLSLVCIGLIRPRSAPVPGKPATSIQRMSEGLRYIAGNRLLLGAMSLDLAAVLLGGATALLPVYARDILHVGPEGLGYLRAASAIGALGIAGWYAWRPLGGQLGPKLLGAVAVFGVATAGFGLSRSLWLSLGFLAVLGAADMVSVVIRQSLMQLNTPDALRGRVGAISTLAISTSNELGAAESGFVAALIGPVVAVVGGGIGAIALAGLWGRWFPELRRASGSGGIIPPDNEEAERDA